MNSISDTVMSHGLILNSALLLLKFLTNTAQELFFPPQPFPSPVVFTPFDWTLWRVRRQPIRQTTSSAPLGTRQAESHCVSFTTVTSADMGRKEKGGVRHGPTRSQGPCGMCSGLFLVFSVIFSSIFVLFFSKMLMCFPLVYAKSGRKGSLTHLSVWQSGN